MKLRRVLLILSLLSFVKTDDSLKDVLQRCLQAYSSTCDGQIQAAVRGELATAESTISEFCSGDAQLCNKTFVALASSGSIEILRQNCTFEKMIKESDSQFCQNLSAPCLLPKKGDGCQLLQYQMEATEMYKTYKDQPDKTLPFTKYCLSKDEDSIKICDAFIQLCGDLKLVDDVIEPICKQENLLAVCTKLAEISLSVTVHSKISDRYIALCFQKVDQASNNFCSVVKKMCNASKADQTPCLDISQQFCNQKTMNSDCLDSMKIYCGMPFINGSAFEKMCVTLVKLSMDQSKKIQQINQGMCSGSVMGSNPKMDYPCNSIVNATFGLNKILAVFDGWCNEKEYKTIRSGCQKIVDKCRNEVNVLKDDGKDQCEKVLKTSLPWSLNPEACVWTKEKTNSQCEAQLQSFCLTDSNECNAIFDKITKEALEKYTWELCNNMTFTFTCDLLIKKSFNSGVYLEIYEAKCQGTDHEKEMCQLFYKDCSTDDFKDKDDCKKLVKDLDTWQANHEQEIKKLIELIRKHCNVEEKTCDDLLKGVSKESLSSAYRILCNETTKVCEIVSKVIVLHDEEAQRKVVKVIATNLNCAEEDELPACAPLKDACEKYSKPASCQELLNDYAFLKDKIIFKSNLSEQVKILRKYCSPRTTRCGDLIDLMNQDSPWLDCVDFMCNGTQSDPICDDFAEAAVAKNGSILPVIHKNFNCDIRLEARESAICQATRKICANKHSVLCEAFYLDNCYDLLKKPTQCTDLIRQECVSENNICYAVVSNLTKNENFTRVIGKVCESNVVEICQHVFEAAYEAHTIFNTFRVWCMQLDKYLPQQPYRPVCNSIGDFCRKHATDSDCSRILDIIEFDPHACEDSWEKCEPQFEKYCEGHNTSNSDRCRILWSGMNTENIVFPHLLGRCNEVSPSWNINYTCSKSLENVYLGNKVDGAFRSNCESTDVDIYKTRLCLLMWKECDVLYKNGCSNIYWQFNKIIVIGMLVLFFFGMMVFFSGLVTCCICGIIRLQEKKWLEKEKKKKLRRDQKRLEMEKKRRDDQAKIEETHLSEYESIG